ncbi:hypothetical protein HDV01_003763 [Terramyces sp. JEL0728]|nr:hypothetical protein HDV01_003744 [Terramyces sp. JEL0728]KAJ3273932.1 hypothetical protein HDV01_003763 [Terramyces sp. JEL0728]
MHQRTNSLQPTSPARQHFRSFSYNSNTEELDILDLIQLECDKKTTNFNLANRNLVHLPPEINKLLGDLQSLEVLDISKNKIKKFPTEFGNLINLKVLSISRNRIQMLPKYLANMNQLNVFKIGNSTTKIDFNPLTWPPLEYLQPEQEKDQEVWIKKLRNYLAENDPPAPNYPLIPAELSPSIKEKECTEIVYTLLSNIKPQDAIVESFLNVLFASVEIYRVSRLSLISNAKINFDIGKIESSTKSLNSQIITTSKLIKESNINNIMQLLKCTRSVVNSVSELDGFQSILEEGLVNDWSKVNQSLRQAILNLQDKSKFENLVSLLNRLKDYVSGTDLLLIQKCLYYSDKKDLKCLPSVYKLLRNCQGYGISSDGMNICAELASEAKRLAK